MGGLFVFLPTTDIIVNPTNGRTASIFAKTTFSAGTSSVVVIVAAIPSPGWLHPVAPGSIKTLARLIKADANGVEPRTVSLIDRADIEGVLGIRLRRTREGRVRLCNPVAICDQRILNAEAA